MPLDEVVVLQSDPFEFERERIGRIVAKAEFVDQLVADVADDPGPGVVVFVDPVPEPDQTHFLRFDATDEVGNRLDAARRAHRGALCDADGARLYRATGHLLNLKREAAARRSRAKIKRA